MYIAVVIGVIVVFLVLVARSSGESETKDPVEEKKQYLTRLCGGNVSQAKRLVEYELERMPGISLNHALDNAIHMLKRDS